MRIEKFVFGPVGTNCYIVINEMTSECFAVDMADCPQEFVKHIKDAGLCVKALLLTHGHFDHIMGAERFAEIFGCPVYAYEGGRKYFMRSGAECIGDDARTVICVYKSRVCKSGYADRNRRLSGGDYSDSGTYRGRMLLLYRRRTCIVQRRYPFS